MKYNFDGLITRYKTRLIVQRFYQVYEIDYIETFASTIRCESLKIFLAIAIMLEIILI